MKFRLFGVAMACLATPLAAQQTGTLSGVITAAESGAPIEGVQVFIEGTLLATFTTAEGEYRLAGVPAGRRVLVVRGIRWRPARDTLDVVAGETTRRDLALAQAIIELEEVVVTATREERDKDLTPATIDAVGRESIDQTRPHHPAELMSQVPGALVVDLGGEGNTMALRQPINFSPVYGYLEDGVPIRSTGFFNHNALYEVNIPGAERVEVLKGPGTALHGSDAIGGVVNVLTRPPTARPTAEVFVEGGRFGYRRTLLSGSDTWGGDGVRLDLNLTDYDGYREGTEQERQSGLLRWDHFFGGDSRLKTVVAFSRIDSPGDGGSDISRADFENSPTRNYTPIAFRKVRAFRVSSAFEKIGRRSRVSVTPYARYNRLELLPSWQLTFDPEVWAIENSSLGLLVQGRRDFEPLNTSVSAGVDLELSPGSHVSDSITPTRAGQVFTDFEVSARLYDYDVTFRGISPYLQVEFSPLPRTRVTAGVRYDRVGYDYDNNLSVVETGNHRRPASTSIWYDHVSPKLGVTYEVLPSLNAFASYRHAFRAPSEGQLFRQGSAEGTVDLQPVRANSYEIGIRGRLGDRVRYEVSAYTMTVKDDILTFFNTTNFTSQTSNAGRSRHRGVEVGAGMGLTSYLRLESAYSYSEHDYLDWVTATSSNFSGNEIESAPRHVANTRLVLSPVRSGSVTVEWQHVGGYFTDPENLHRYDGYDLLNIYFTAPVVRGLAVVGRVNNLADTRYAVTTSFNPFVAPDQQERFNPGLPRTFFVGAQYRWGG